MNDDLYSDIALEETMSQQFHKKMDITRMIVRNMQVGVNAYASLFRVKGGAVYVLLRSTYQQMTVADVKRIVREMGLETSEMLPPAAVEEYFVMHATRRFKEVYPGRRDVSDDDLRYYMTLVPYSPALLKVSKIKGEIKEYDPQARAWHVIKQMSYNHIGI
jgi:hypothetical protein